MRNNQKMANKFVSRFVTTGAVFVLGLGLSACSSGIGDTELELNGKVFDALGIASSGPKTEPKLSQRAPLILPPDDQTLPVPGQRGAQAEVWPDDPDARKKRMAALAKQKTKERCDGGNFKKSQGVEAIANASDPLRDCSSGNFLKAIGIGRSDKGSDDDAK